MYNSETIDAIRSILISKKQTVACAESVTSGHLQAALSSATAASEFFQGGITAYNLAQKTRHLHVDPVHAMSCNCVSSLVAEQMANNATGIFQCDWAISITGYASPLPELGIENLFAFWAISFKGKIQDSDLITADKHEPLDVQILYTNELLARFLKCLQVSDQRIK